MNDAAIARDLLENPAYKHVIEKVRADLVDGILSSQSPETCWQNKVQLDLLSQLEAGIQEAATEYAMMQLRRKSRG